MAHFAQVADGVVAQVIVADTQEWCETNLGGQWVQTSYNTRGGIHYGQDGQPDGGVALRGNYAGIGFIYDSKLDIFYPPKPYPSWNLNEKTATWEPPIPMPTDGKYYQWDEATTSWVDISTPEGNR